MSVATPVGYGPNTQIVEQAREFAHLSGAEIEISNNAGHAVKSAHAVYTDVWASMGQETEAEERNRLFAPYQVNEQLLANARGDTLFMHCLPAKRGLEVTDEVMESQQCVAFDQAENRLHVQKAVLLMLLQ
jgi:ornithine carbamoyltransferase